MKKTVYIGVGSNLDNPSIQIDTVMQYLTSCSQINIISLSSKYFTAPMGPADQPDYVNIVFKAETDLEPIALLDFLQSVENYMGRDRDVIRWGARIIDLDILLYDDFVIDCDRLTVPHRGISQRCFVLCPLVQIEPEIDVPGVGKIADLAQKYSAEIKKVQD